MLVTFLSTLVGVLLDETSALNTEKLVGSSRLHKTYKHLIVRSKEGKPSLVN